MISHVPGKELTIVDALSRALVSTFYLAYEEARLSKLSQYRIDQDAANSFTQH